MATVSVASTGMGMRRNTGSTHQRRDAGAQHLQSSPGLACLQQLQVLLSEQRNMGCSACCFGLELQLMHHADG